MKDKGKASMRICSDEDQEVTGTVREFRNTNRYLVRRGFSYCMIMVGFSGSLPIYRTLPYLLSFIYNIVDNSTSKILQQQLCAKVNMKFVHSIAIVMPAPSILCSVRSRASIKR